MSAAKSVTTEFDYDKLATDLSAASTDAELFSAIVDAPFNHPLPAALIFLGIIVFLQVDKTTGTINRIALSKTEQARRTTDVSVVPFHDIKIPVGYLENAIADAVATGVPSDTTDWKFLFNPVLEAGQARINQANAGIAYSAVYPLKSRDGGALIFSYYQYQQEIGAEQTSFMETYTKLVDTALAGKKPTA